MSEPWEAHAYRKQQEYNPQDYCGNCGEYFGKSNLEEYEDILVCRNCLEILEEENKIKNCKEE